MAWRTPAARRHPRCRLRARGPRARRRGSYVVALAVSATVLLSFGAFAIDATWLQLTAEQAQNAADAGAHAALVAVQAGDSYRGARRVARDVMARTLVAGDPAEISHSDVLFGGWDFHERTFDPTTPYVNAVRVRVRRTADSPGGPVSLLLGTFAPEVDLVSPTPATAVMRSREIVLVVDVSASFQDDIDQVTEGAVGVVDFLDTSGFPDDRLGMVHFTGETHWGPTQGGAPHVRSPFTAVQRVQGNAYDLRAQWETLDWCYQSSTSDLRRHIVRCVAGGGGENHGAGLRDAIAVLDDSDDPYTVKTLVLVSNGVPSCGSDPDCSTWDRTLYGWMMAGRAKDRGYSTYVVSYNPTYSDVQKGYLWSLTTGFGTFHETDDAEDLPLLLQEIARETPVALVR